MLNVKNLLSRDKRADGGQDGANAPKEPFAALLPDEASREITAAVAAEFGWEKADVAPGTIADAVRTAGIEPSTQILLVDLGESADPEADIAALHDLLGNETALICVGTINDVKFYRQIHHAGAADYLVKPLDAEALRAAFRRIEESRERRKPTGERGRITVVIGTRGGVGASTVAANMAWLLADKSKEKVALIDLDFRFGTLALQLDLESGSGLHEALRQPDRVDELFLERSMRQAASNLSLLSTEEPLGEPSTFTPASIMLLLEQISLRYSWVVVDLPRHAAGTQREVLSIATDVILVAELSLASLRDTLRLRELIRLSAPSAKLRIVGCRTTSSKAHLAQSDYESAIKAKLDVVVPFDPVPLAKSANAGKPLAQVARNGKATATLRKLVAELRKGAIVNVPGSSEFRSATVRVTVMIGPDGETAQYGEDTAQGEASSSPPQHLRGPMSVGEIERLIIDRVKQQGGETLATLSKRDLGRRVSEAAAGVIAQSGRRLSLIEQRDIVARALDALSKQSVGSSSPSLAPSAANAPVSDDETPAKPGGPGPTGQLQEAMRLVQPILMERVDLSAVSQVKREDLTVQISQLIVEILAERRMQLNRNEQGMLVGMLLDDMLGLGPLEPLLADEAVNDILVNGPNQVYVERAGKLELTGVKFRDNAQVMNVATRIVTRIGRRVDESTPMVDARLADGSRVNIIAPPCALDGTTISIRKFAKRKLTLDSMVRQGNISAPLANLLRIAARCRLNIIISGGTGSGKTTLLNAISEMIDHGERIVTIEDAAELKLQQPHVVRLETRPANLEDRGEITMRDLVKNALRMRPDRIILGEVRGAETLDMLQAMNTGHDGSMCTVHANNPREALTRIENMVAMAGFKLGNKAVRGQMSAAINLIVQISRMRDGVRRIANIVEVVGMEEETILTQELFRFEFQGEHNGRLMGTHVSSQIRPHFITRAEYYGLDRALMETMSCPT